MSKHWKNMIAWVILKAMVSNKSKSHSLLFAITKGQGELTWTNKHYSYHSTCTLSTVCSCTKPIQLYQAQRYIAPRLRVLLCLGRFVMERERSRVGLFLGNNPALTSKKEKLGEGGWRRRGGFFGIAAALFSLGLPPPNPTFSLCFSC